MKKFLISFCLCCFFVTAFALHLKDNPSYVYFYNLSSQDMSAKYKIQTSTRFYSDLVFIPANGYTKLTGDEYEQYTMQAGDIVSVIGVRTANYTQMYNDDRCSTKAPGSFELRAAGDPVENIACFAGAGSKK